MCLYFYRSQFIKQRSITSRRMVIFFIFSRVIQRTTTICDKVTRGRIRAPTICTSYIWQVSGNLSALRMIERLETDRDAWDGRRRWIATAKRSQRGGRREMLKLKFSQVIWTLSVTRVVWIECHLLDLNEWAAVGYKGGWLEEDGEWGYNANPFLEGTVRASNARRTTSVEKRASASQIENPHPRTHYFLILLVQIFVRD